MEVIIQPDANSVAQLAADIFTAFIKRGTLVMGTATGSTPLALYKELIRRHQEEGLSFANVTTFQLDEYVGISPDHERSYYQTIRHDFTSHLDIPDSAVHVPDAQRQDLEQSARDYEKAINDAGGVEIQLLGIGTDGHLAFDEPGSSLTSRTRLKTLNPQTVKDNARFFASPEEVPIHVLTQGLGTIMEARNLVLIATGKNKAQAIADMVEGPVSSMCPASVLQMHQHVTVIVDEGAASKLTHTDYYNFAYANKPEWQRPGKRS